MRPLFRLFGVPVTILPWHFVLLVILFANEFTRNPAIGVLLMLLASVSVLAHEMGHALVSRAFQLQPHVVLSSFGGFTRHQPASRPRDEFLVIAAGPAMNLVLGQVFLFTVPWLASEVGPMAGAVAGQMARLNFWWAIYNLLPVMPLDGGLLMRILLRKVIKGVQADRVALRISLVLGGMVFGWMLWTMLRGDSSGYAMLFAMLVAMMLLRNWQMLKALDEIPEVRADAKHERVRELIAAGRTAFETGLYEEAMRACHQARAEPWVSQEELAHIWHVLALAAARLERWEEALRYAERVPGSQDMAQLQAVCLLALGDSQRARRFLSTPAAVLLPAERVGALQELARGA
jgi:Zn-dependent protease